MPPPIIEAIAKVLKQPLHAAPEREEDRVAAVLPKMEGKPLRYVLRGDQLVGLNLAEANLTDRQWQEIRALPGFDLGKIEALNLRGNKLKQSPIEGMTQLRLLDLCENELTEVLPNIESVIHLEKVWLYDNPNIITPPPEIVKRGPDAVLGYFISVVPKEGKAKRLYEAKMLILGEGGAGKTSLARRLINRKADMPTKEESTRGIDVLSYEFKINEGETFQLRFWDFAGQEIYHATHQFFLTKRSLYVLVDNTRFSTTEGADNTFYYWFRVAELYGDQSPLLLVQNEMADRSKDINYSGFVQDFPFVKGRYPVNIQSNRGLDALAEAISDFAMQLPHVGEVWSEQWLDARRALEVLGEKRDYIDYETFIQTLEESGVSDEKQAEVLSDFLHDLGVILYYKDEPALCNLVILRHQWAIDAVYKVLDHEGVKGRFGKFTQRDIDSIWSDNKYRFRKAELLLLMERFELCYKLPEEPEDTWLATQLLPEEAPNIPWDDYQNLYVRYVFRFMPKGLIPRFIVRNNQYVGNTGRAWKYGVEMTGGATAAKVTAHYGSNTIEIRVNNRGDNRAFLRALVEDMDRLLGSFGERMVVEKMLPCNCVTCALTITEPHYFKYADLKRRIEVLKKDTIECAKSGEDILVKPFLELFFGTSKEPMKKIFLSYSHVHLDAAKRMKTALAVQTRSGKCEFWYDQAIDVGDDWEASIEEKIDEADVFILLLSAEFWDSGFIWDKELPLIEERQKEGARVVCVMLTDNDFLETDWARLQALPLKDGNLVPIERWGNRDEAWQAVTEGVKRIL